MIMVIMVLHTLITPGTCSGHQMKSNKNFQIVGSDYQMSVPRVESRDTMSHNNSGQPAARA